jgi:hypothetical protein
MSSWSIEKLRCPQWAHDRIERIMAQIQPNEQTEATRHDVFDYISRLVMSSQQGAQACLHPTKTCIGFIVVDQYSVFTSKNSIDVCLLTVVSFSSPTGFLVRLSAAENLSARW